ncbi:hypothetical protein FS935_00080 [Metabacillus litoralis]|uniref:Uncharacterized protein n=1 Tax=Metabacillus litoralis TaxID=152268 RepID=A0A5C6W9W6_9BACI|nr:hypothetical protein [Metabacillus litoralis]TXC92649.1 hypothetical protein FS935_00080 [Metabacillus litoralis]
MSRSKKIGDGHVLDVVKNIKRVIEGETLYSKEETTLNTVNYILGEYPNIIDIESKFEKSTPDKHADITITLDSSSKVDINLFLIKGKGKIQPKNLGALSFLKKYFHADDIQLKFNQLFEIEYLSYLREIDSKNENEVLYKNKTELKKSIERSYSHFSEEIEPIRQGFLFKIREHCFTLLREQYNERLDDLNKAFKDLLLLDSTNIITRYNNKNECLCVETLNFQYDNSSTINIYKKGRNSIGLSKGNTSLLIRFKFESGPTSSIKLATSYEEIFNEDKQIEDRNKKDLYEFEKLIKIHKQTKDGNISNAIGKCNEALVYYEIINSNLSVKQVDNEEYKTIFNKYSDLIPFSTIKDMMNTNQNTIMKLNSYLTDKYKSYTIDSIQLVPDSYMTNRLDTSDLKLVLLVHGKMYEEKFSLKAYSKKVKKLTTKNPGVGTILSDQYFGIGSMENTIAETKELFSNNTLDHQQCLIKVTEEIGKKLKSAQQHELKQGIRNLLGESALIISFYSQNESVILEHGNVNTKVNVLEKFPSLIQTTLTWNENNEELSLRVKFSSGHDKGWSSLKLSCEVKLNI